MAKDNKHAIRQTIRYLLSKHRSPAGQRVIARTVRCTASWPASHRGALASATLLVAELPGFAIVVTRELYDHAAGGEAPMTQPTVPPLKRQPLKKILALTRSDWDHEKIRPAVREAFRKVLDCGTAALGAEVFASGNGERVVFHTCKSRACPSCGYRATTLWQREQWRDLPETRYTHVTLTMPDVLWPLFRQNRHLLHDLPVLGAKIIEHWAFQTYGVRLMILVIPHTFGRHLNFNCHLHMLVSEGGLNADGTAWRKAPLDRKALMPLWRYAVVTHLREAYRKGLLETEQTTAQLSGLLSRQHERWWNTHIQRFRGKKQFLGYAGRYARRPPIAQRRFQKH